MVFFFPSFGPVPSFPLPLAVATLHQGTPRQMTWLEDPPPWLRPAYCFASVIV